MAGTEYELTGDFPWNERARGGSRMYTSSVTGNVTRPSQQQPREDDFAALRMAALEELDPKRQARTAVLPQREVRLGVAAALSEGGSTSGGARNLCVWRERGLNR